MRLFVAAIALAWLVASAGLASAGTSGPSPSPSPTPTPVHTLGSMSMRFVQNGRPVEILTGSPVAGIFADGGQCFPDISFLAIVGLSSGWSMPWPYPSLLDGSAAACSQPPPTLIRFEFSGFDRLDPEYIWTGGDQRIDVEIAEPRIDILTLRFARAGRQVAINEQAFSAQPRLSHCLTSSIGAVDGRIDEIRISLGPWTGCVPGQGQNLEIAIGSTSSAWPHAIVSWMGGDQTAFVEVPDGIPTTDLGAPVPTVTPASLPATGGQPADTDWHTGFLAAGLATLIVALIAVRFRRVIA